MLDGRAEGELCAARALTLVLAHARELASEPRINRPELKAVLRLALGLALDIDDAIHNQGEDATNTH